MQPMQEQAVAESFGVIFGAGRTQLCKREEMKKGDRFYYELGWC
jgi:hypothetical protein